MWSLVYLRLSKQLSTSGGLQHYTQRSITPIVLCVTGWITDFLVVLTDEKTRKRYLLNREVLIVLFSEGV